MTTTRSSPINRRWTVPKWKCSKSTSRKRAGTRIETSKHIPQAPIPNLANSKWKTTAMLGWLNSRPKNRGAKPTNWWRCRARRGARYRPTTCKAFSHPQTTWRSGRPDSITTRPAPSANAASLSCPTTRSKSESSATVRKWRLSKRRGRWKHSKAFQTVEVLWQNDRKKSILLILLSNLLHLTWLNIVL